MHRRSLTSIKANTCNTIDDVTGMVVKLDQTSTRWDGIQCTERNMEPRQPQDFLPSPRPAQAYSYARPDVPMPTATPPDWNALP